jgi:pimeloyl-ACP methyl ester carboxylesterase
VVFVHGFIGDYRITWGNFPELILQDPELKGFDVFLWGYPSHLLGKNPEVRFVAQQLKTELTERLAGYRNIYLIGHSLGGLVIQSLVIEQLKVGQAKNLHPIKHIVLFGTPNRGVEVPPLLKLIDLQLRDLDSKSEIVDEIRNEWIDRVYNPTISAGAKDYKLQIPVTVVAGLQDEWVTEKSARSFFRDPPPQTVPGNHITMKQPKDREGTAYLLVKRRLLESAATSAGRTTTERRDIRLPLPSGEYGKEEEPISMRELPARLQYLVKGVKHEFTIDQTNNRVALYSVSAEAVRERDTRRLLQDCLNWLRMSFQHEGLNFERVWSEKGKEINKRISTIEKIIKDYDKKIEAARRRGNEGEVTKLGRERSDYVARKDDLAYELLTDEVALEKLPPNLLKALSILLSTRAAELYGGRSFFLTIWFNAKTPNERTKWEDKVTIEYIPPTYLK